MRKKHIPAGSMVLLLLALCSARDATGTPTSADLLEQCRQNLDAISSLSYSATIRTSTFTDKNEDINSPSEECISQSFVWSNSKYRSLMTPCTGSDESAVIEFAFDGALYQELHRGQSTLNVTRRRPRVPYGVMEAVTTAHLFLLAPDPNSDVSLDTIRRQETWECAKKAAHYLGRREEFGKPCEVVTITYPVPEGFGHQQVQHEVSLATDLAFFPIRWESRVDGQLASVWETRECITYSTSSLKAVVPVYMEGYAFTPDGQLWQSTVVSLAKETVKVNAPVPEETFRIPPTSAISYIDNDLLMTKPE